METLIGPRHTDGTSSNCIAGLEEALPLVQTGIPSQSSSVRLGHFLARLIFFKAPRIAGQQPSITVARQSHAFDMPMYRYASRSRLSHFFLSLDTIKNNPLVFMNHSSTSLSPDSQTFERLFVDLLRHRSAQLLSVDLSTIRPQRPRCLCVVCSSAWLYDKTYHQQVDIAKPPSALAFLSRLDRSLSTSFSLQVRDSHKGGSRSGRDEAVQMAVRSFNHRAP